MALSATQYAEHRGVDKSSVLKAIRMGRLSERSYRRLSDGQYEIDEDAADREWAATTQLAGGGDAIHRDMNNVADGEEPGDEENPREQMMRAQLRAKQAQAEIKMLELGMKRAALVKRSMVELNAARLGLAVRQRVLQVPKMASSRLVGQTDILKIEKILEDVCVQVLSNLGSGSNLEEIFNEAKPREDSDEDQ